MSAAVRLDEDSTVEEVMQALGHLNADAKKCHQIVGNDTWKSPWDIAHEWINDALDKLEVLRG